MHPPCPLARGAPQIIPKRSIKSLRAVQRLRNEVIAMQELQRATTTAETTTTFGAVPAAGAGDAETKERVSSPMPTVALLGLKVSTSTVYLIQEVHAAFTTTFFFGVAHRVHSCLSPG